jgi:hypothetical protein
MGWFATILAIGFLSCNEHLQFITTQHISTSVNVVWQVAWISTNTTHHMWNHIQITLCHVICAIQFQLCRNNYYITIMQLLCNYNGNVMLMPFPSIHQNLTHDIMEIFGWKLLFFEILISTIHYDCLFMMELDCDTWHNLKVATWHINWI